MEATGTDETEVSTRLPAKERFLLLTLATVATYVALHRLPLPGLGNARILGSSIWFLPHLGVLDLTWRPFFTGFLLTEMAAFLLPPLQRLRHGGFAGRRRLTAFAVQVAVGVALVQGASRALLLETQSGDDGLPLAAVPIPLFRLLVVVSLVAGSCLVFGVGRYLAGRMLAGGFVLFLLVDRLLARWRFAPTAWRQLSSVSIWKGPFAVLILALLVILSVRVLRHQRSVDVTGPVGEVVALRLPAFPQGVLPVLWLLALVELEDRLVDLVGSVDQALPRRYDLGLPFDSMVFAMLMAAFVAALSWVGFHLFSSPVRLEASLPSTVALPSDLGSLLSRHGRATTGLLVAGVTGFALLDSYLGFEVFGALDLATVVVLACGAVEIVSKWRFSASHPQTVLLAELDNVHLASYLRGLLTAHGIECRVENWVFRGLYFFLGSLFKMRLVVPHADTDRALGLLRLDEIEIA